MERDSELSLGSAEEEKVNSIFDRRSYWERLEPPQDQRTRGEKVLHGALMLIVVAVLILATLSASWPYTISAS